mgnify:FL=1
MINMNIKDDMLVNRDITSAVINKVSASRRDVEFLSDIDSVLWVASIRPQETQLSSFEDDTRKYEEIQLLEISVHTYENIYIISRTIMKAIPYPIILLVLY